MEKKFKESFSKLEAMDCELSKLKDLCGLLLETCFTFKVESLQNYELREKYMTAQILTNTIFDLIHYQSEDTAKFIRETYTKKEVNN